MVASISIPVRVSYQLFSSALCQVLLACMVFLSPSVFSQPAFEEGVLSLPSVQVGDERQALSLTLTDQNSLTFTLDTDNIQDVTGQTPAACFDPYVDSQQDQLIIPMLDVGTERYQVVLDLVDAAEGIYQVNPSSLRLLNASVADSPSFAVWQAGNSISVEWGSPEDGADGYLVWYAAFPSQSLMALEDAGSLTAMTVELPQGADYCLAVSSYGPAGESDFSEIQRFTNHASPYKAYLTDDDSLPAILFPDQVDDTGLAVMFDARVGDKTTGGAFSSEDDEQLVVVTFNPWSGLLSQVGRGDTLYQFVNYTPTTVDVIESLAAGDTSVFPDVPLSNHAISIVDGLVTNAVSPASQTSFVAPGEQEIQQSADWSKQGLELALEILSRAASEGHQVDQDILERIQSYSASFRSDVFKASLEQASGGAEQETEQFLAATIDRFGCAGDPGFACGAFGVNQADFQELVDSYPDSIGGQSDLLRVALEEAIETAALLNQDCDSIAEIEAQQACQQLQGNPQPQEQEDPIPANASQSDALGDEVDLLHDIFAAATGTASVSELNLTLSVNELYFEYQDMIGETVWIVGYYGDESYNEDGYGFLLDEPTRLDVDRALPHHSHARLDGNLPAQDWNRAEVLIYGQIKDFEQETGAFVLDPTPLITVIEAVQLNPPVEVGVPAASPYFESVLEMTLPGTQAAACDRVIIIGGGVDASNNKIRYKQAITAMYNKMKALGFSDDQIDVYYNNGSAIEVDGSNIVDSRAGKQAILDQIATLKEQMAEGCSLSVFVSDHGTGQESGETYHGARPAETGIDATTGIQHAESSFVFDARPKAYQRTNVFNYNGQLYGMEKKADGTIKLYRKEGEDFVLKGTDENKSGVISEIEASVDFNNDGDDDDNFGLRVAWMESMLQDPFMYRSNSWDYDGDGSTDIRLRWDGSRFVVERNDEGAWKEMGRDSNGDFIINAADGGVDWNLDGDVFDLIGFHEGIDLWGSEVLWDDELAAALTPLNDKGISLNGFMVSCFSGGFVPNLQGIMTNIVTGSNEDEVHWSRADATKQRIHDTNAFLNNLNGIDSMSWTHAATKAIEADTMIAGNGSKNGYTRTVESDSKFQEITSGEYNIELDLPDFLIDKVYDFELIFDYQVPLWDGLSFGFPLGLPPGMNSELIPGGIRVFSDTPIPDNLKFRIMGLPGSDQINFGLTDTKHDSLGYTVARPGTVVLDKFVHVSDISGTFSHFSGYSEIYPKVKVVDSLGDPVGGAAVTVNIDGREYTKFTDASGEADFRHVIYYYGNYSVKVLEVSGEGLQYAPSQNAETNDTIVVN